MKRNQDDENYVRNEEMRESPNPKKKPKMERRSSFLNRVVPVALAPNSVGIVPQNQQFFSNGSTFTIPQPRIVTAIHVPSPPTGSQFSFLALQEELKKDKEDLRRDKEQFFKEKQLFLQEKELFFLEKQKYFQNNTKKKKKKKKLRPPAVNVIPSPPSPVNTATVQQSNFNIPGLTPRVEIKKEIVDGTDDNDNDKLKSERKRMYNKILEDFQEQQRKSPNVDENQHKKKRQNNQVSDEVDDVSLQIYDNFLKECRETSEKCDGAILKCIRNVKKKTTFLKKEHRLIICGHDVDSSDKTCIYYFYAPKGIYFPLQKLFCIQCDKITNVLAVSMGAAKRYAMICPSKRCSEYGTYFLASPYEMHISNMICYKKLRWKDECKYTQRKNRNVLKNEAKCLLSAFKQFEKIKHESRTRLYLWLRFVVKYDLHKAVHKRVKRNSTVMHFCAEGSKKFLTMLDSNINY